MKKELILKTLFVVIIFSFHSCTSDNMESFTVNDMVQNEFTAFYTDQFWEEMYITAIYLDYNPEKLKLPFLFSKKNIYAITNRGSKIPLEGLSIDGNNIFKISSIEIEKKKKKFTYTIIPDTIPTSINPVFPPVYSLESMELPRKPDSLQIAFVFYEAKDSIAAIQFDESDILWIKDENPDILADDNTSARVRITGRVLSEDNIPQENLDVYLVKSPELAIINSEHHIKGITNKKGEFIIDYDRPLKREYYSLACNARAFQNCNYIYIKGGKGVYTKNKRVFIKLDNKSTIVNVGDLQYKCEYTGPRFTF